MNINFKKNKKNYHKTNWKQSNGLIIIQTIVFAAIAISIISALANWAAISIKASNKEFNREEALQIAESGIEYYRWHLAHAPSDFRDGTNNVGPYVHSVKDRSGNIVGQFSLQIIAPANGSTIVKMVSTGKVSADSSVFRKIQSIVAKPSIARYAFAGNSDMRFGEGTEIFGPIHSNGGIRFDGLAHNLVTSALLSYTDPDHSGNPEFAVHTHLNIPPVSGISTNALPSELSSLGTMTPRSDVFIAGRQTGMPAIQFSGFTADLGVLKTQAQTTSGFYRGLAGNGFVGYHVVLKTNGSFDLYKINSWATANGSCLNTNDNETNSWSINTETLQGNYSFPVNGIIFIEDNTVVDGQINGARLTIVAATLPANSSTYKRIIINNSLTYTHYDGTDVIGLIGQNGVMTGMKSDDNLKIEGALIAQNGKVGRFYYGSSCSPYNHRNSITLYGMIASNARYGYAYTDGTSYTTRNINYDANLLYGPPPYFPLTSDQYQILSWEELEN